MRSLLAIALSALIWIAVAPTANAQTASPQVLHVLNRLAYGAQPGDVAKVQTLGVDRYIQEQLYPERISEPPELINKLAQFQTLKLSPTELLQRYAERQKPGVALAPNGPQRQRKQLAEIPQEALQARILRSVESNRQLQEVMVDFWFNHFNVFSGKGRTRFLVGSYEEKAIRPHILGRFRDLLGSTAHHPAMLFYLDNWQNTAPESSGAKGRFQGINENYARELMELHTLGVNGGYTQQDVTTLARILTGWGIVKPGSTNDSGFDFQIKRHDRSDKVFLGQRIAGGGEDEGEKALDILARHPKTAQFISYKLAQYFVTDQPPKPLVDRLAQTYLSTDGTIRTLLETLFKSPEFWQTQTVNSKFKTPYQYTISAVRATGQPLNNTRPIVNVLEQLGMPLYGKQTPDGYANTQETWLNPEGMMRRLDFATTLATGRFGNGQPVDPMTLTQTLGDRLSTKTQAAIAQSPPNLRAALILGSPEFMQH